MSNSDCLYSIKFWNCFRILFLLSYCAYDSLILIKLEIVDTDYGIQTFGVPELAIFPIFSIKKTILRVAKMSNNF